MLVTAMLNSDPVKTETTATVDMGPNAAEMAVALQWAVMVNIDPATVRMAAEKWQVRAAKKVAVA